MAPLRYAAKFDPFLSLDCASTPSTPAQSKERKGSNFAIWQPWLKDWNEVQREKRMAMAAGSRAGGGGRAGGNPKQADRRQVIKGVRMNKRAELLLKKRQMT